eukprot:ANDGO_04860.mRNA.1 hypothetical protein
MSNDMEGTDATLQNAVPLVDSTVEMWKQYYHLFFGQLCYSLTGSLLKIFLAPFCIWLYDGSSFSAVIYGLLTAVLTLTQYVTLPVVGMFSQSRGRRPAHLVANTLNFLGCCCLIPVVSRSMLFLLFIAMVLIGLGSGVAAINYALSTDVMAPRKRSTFVSVILVCTSALPSIIAAGIASFMVDTVAWPLCFTLLACFALLACFVFFFSFRETLRPESKVVFSWRELNPLVPLYRWVTRPFINCAFVAYGLWGYSIAFVLFFSYFYAYFKFGLAYSVYIPVALGVGLLSVVFFLLAGPFCRKFGSSTCFLFSLVWLFVVFIGLAFANTVTSFLVIVVFASPTAMAPTALVDMVGKRLEKHEQGPFQSYLTSILFFAYFVAGITMGVILSETAKDENPAKAATVLWVCVACLGVAIILFMYARKYPLTRLREAQKQDAHKSASGTTFRITLEDEKVQEDGSPDSVKSEDVQMACAPVSPQDGECERAFPGDTSIITVTASDVDLASTGLEQQQGANDADNEVLQHSIASCEP